MQLLEGAIQAVRRDDKDSAVAQLKELLAADPGHEVAGGMLASLYAELGMADRAAAQFSRVLAQHPGNVLARFQLGVLLLGQGQAQQALDTLAPMLAAADDYLAHFHSGLACMAMRQPARARPLFEAAAGRMPPNHPLQAQLQAMLEATE